MAEKSYSYRYESDDGKPLTTCPSCGADLTAELSIDLTLSCGGHVFMVKTRLNNNGDLIDVDGAVANGNHSSTDCAACGEELVYYEVEE